jgi:hypothetical protein
LQSPQESLSNRCAIDSKSFCDQLALIAQSKRVTFEFFATPAYRCSKGGRVGMQCRQQEGQRSPASTSRRISAWNFLRALGDKLNILVIGEGRKCPLAVDLLDFVGNVADVLPRAECRLPADPEGRFLVSVPSSGVKLISK